MRFAVQRVPRSASTGCSAKNTQTRGFVQPHASLVDQFLVELPFRNEFVVRVTSNGSLLALSLRTQEMKHTKSRARWLIRVCSFLGVYSLLSGCPWGLNIATTKSAI